MTKERKDHPTKSHTDLSRREFVAFSLAAGLTLAAPSVSGTELNPSGQFVFEASFLVVMHF